MLTKLVSPLDSRPLGLTRILVGIAAVTKAFVVLPVMAELVRPGIIQIAVVDWMPNPSPTLIWTLLGLWVVSGVLFILGWRVPITGTVLLFCTVFPLLLDAQTYSNHLYLMSWLVFLVVIADGGAGRTFWGSARPVVFWGVFLIALQTSVVYLFSALTKVNPDFLSGEVLAGVLADGMLIFPAGLRTPRVLMPTAVLAVVVETFLAFALWSPRLRTIGYALGIGLHVSITLLMADTMELLVFSILMFATYPLFAQLTPATGGMGESSGQRLSEPGQRPLQTFS